MGVADQRQPLAAGPPCRRRPARSRARTPRPGRGGRRGRGRSPCAAAVGSSSRRNSSVRLADPLPGPLDRRGRRLREGGDVELAEHGEVVVADQAGVAALADQLGAGVGVGPVADHVSQAPDLLDPALRSALASTASRAGRLAWMSVIAATRKAAQRTRPPALSIRCPDDARNGEATMSTDSIAELRIGGQRGRPRPARRGAERPRARRSTGRRSPSSATTAPTRRCCSPRRSAKTRATSPAASAPSSSAELGGESGSVERIEVAGPGFVNLFLADAWYRRAMQRLAESGEDLGPAPTASPERILVEFVSANPTGPAARRRRPPRRLRRRPRPPPARRSGTRSSASTTSTTRGGQIERFASSIAARMTGERAARGRLRRRLRRRAGRADRGGGDRRRRHRGDRQRAGSS